VTGTEEPQNRFERQLRVEASRVLDDVIFRRAPVQSKLFSFLLERTLSKMPTPTQYEIAVDGLGKGDDYDLSSDSYPRVQISRLRKNLDNYYARNLPHGDMRVEIDSSSYRLILAPTKPKTGEVSVNSDSESVRSFSEFSTTRSGHKWALWAGAAVLLLVLIAWIGLNRMTSSNAGDDASTKPLIALSIDPSPVPQNPSEAQRISAIAQQIADIQLTNSFVSNLARAGSAQDRESYRMSIKIGPDGAGNNVALLALNKADNELLYTNTIAFDETDPIAFSSELEASLIYLTSPNGAIAASEMQNASDPLDSDYTCFLTIEGRRADGEEAARLVERCLELFPQSEFRPFWYARRAFTEYQKAVIGGRPLEKRGAAWGDLQRALDADPHNAFANFIAAKVELANDRCDDAVAYVARALERGGSYPTLIAAIETDAASCISPTEKSIFNVGRASTVARNNPSPDPLLHLYLMVAAISIDDRTVAEQVARRTVIAKPEGPVELTSDLLRRSIEDPTFAEENRAALRENIRLFVWNKGAVDRIIERLVVGA